MEYVPVKADPAKWPALYSDLLFQYCLPRVTDRGIAEDIVQDTFLAALKGLDGFKAASSEKNWLFGILKNKIVDHYRKKNRNLEFVHLLDNEVSDDGWFNADGNWDTNKRPGEMVVTGTGIEQKEIRRIILLCKDHLKTLQQQVFVLKYMEGMNSEEICKVLHISPTNYWTVIHRARLQMRACIEKKWNQ